MEPTRGLIKGGWVQIPSRLWISFDGTRPLRNCNLEGFGRGVGWRDLAECGGIWKVLAGFGGNRFLTVLLLACKRSVQRRVSAWQATLAQIPSFPSCARRHSHSAPLCQPLFGCCRQNARLPCDQKSLKKTNWLPLWNSLRYPSMRCKIASEWRCAILVHSVFEQRF